MPRPRIEKAPLNHGRTKKNTRSVPKQRFWSNVEIVGCNECWRWKLSKNRDGYGMLRWGGKMTGAHRIAYLLTHGSIPATFEGAKSAIIHTCDNPACCNPAHLLLRNHLANMRDKKKKGRNRMPEPTPGEKNFHAKLTEKQVLSIRRDPRKQSEIASDYGVTQSTVSEILSRSTWTHVP